jgi:hypothetical protein
MLLTGRGERASLQQNLQVATPEFTRKKANETSKNSQTRAGPLAGSIVGRNRHSRLGRSRQ